MEDKKELLEALEVLQKTKGQFQNGSALYFYIKDNKEVYDNLFKLSKVFLEIQLGYCESCWMSAYMQLADLDLEFAKKKLECVFRLKENALIYLENRPITNYNLTNELAIEYLKINPDGKQWFSTLPSNLEELLSQEEVKEEVEETPVVIKKKAGRPKKNKD